MPRPYRIGSGAGYAGDRIDPARDLAERGRLDALVFECLAERTIALAQLRRRHDPHAGYDPLLAERLRAVLPACVAQGTTVITNMGAANPLAAGQVALAVARELQLPRLRVAVVTGDDVLPWLRQHDAPLLDGGPDLGPDLGPDRGPDRPPERATTAHGLGERLISANAYLGADALLPALNGGAQLVITGRVADPALFLAPLMHHFGWAGNDWPLLGRGTAVGHLLECAAQVSGGYIAEPGRFDVPGLETVGFPLAEVQADGRFTVTKLPGTGGVVNRLTCTAQLLYEIEDPAAYRQADVTADFSAVTLHDDGPDRVTVHGASGHPRPEPLKATLGWHDGYIGEGQISYGGPGAQARGELALRVLAHRLQNGPLAGLEHRAELIGVNALHGPGLTQRIGPMPEPWEVRLRLAVRCPTRAAAERVGQEVEALYLNGPAGGGGVSQQVREVVAAASCLVPRHAAQTAVHWLTWSGA